MAKNDDIKFSDLTTGEKIRMGLIVARMIKRSPADDGSGRVLEDLKQKAARIEARAIRRKQAGK